MTHLGDLGWINDYIGIPYIHNGRDMKGLDCYGLCKLIYQEEYSEELPDWLLQEFDLKATNEAISSVVTSGSFTEVKEPSDGDFVVCFRTRAAHHMGLYYGRGVLHCANGIGVVYEPVHRFVDNYVKVIYGVWEP